MTFFIINRSGTMIFNEDYNGPINKLIASSSYYYTVLNMLWSCLDTINCRENGHLTIEYENGYISSLYLPSGTIFVIIHKEKRNISGFFKEVCDRYKEYILHPEYNVGDGIRDCSFMDIIKRYFK